MKVLNVIIKVVLALAALAGIVYVVATYGDKIVAWAKKMLGSCKCCCGDGDCCCDEECCCEEDCCCNEECCEEECFCDETAVEEIAAEEAPVVEAANEAEEA